jgi:hypothetical protein
VTLIRSEALWLAVYFHRWRAPKKWRVRVMDWLETMTCLGFATVHYEREWP